MAKVLFPCVRYSHPSKVVRQNLYRMTYTSSDICVSMYTLWTILKHIESFNRWTYFDIVKPVLTASVIRQKSLPLVLFVGWLLTCTITHSYNVYMETLYRRRVRVIISYRYSVNLYPISDGYNVHMETGLKWSLTETSSS